MLDPQQPGYWKLWRTSITTNDSTRAKILADETPAKIVDAIAGEIALEGETNVRQRILTGGQRIIHGGLASTDGTARQILIWLGTILSRQSAMGTASITGTNAINRTSGSFITDGWRKSDVVMLFDAPTEANNGTPQIITAVTASALTVNGTPYTNETLTTCRLVNVSQLTRKAVAINAGNADTTPPVPLMGGSQDPAALPPPYTGIELDKDSIIAVSAVAAISALPARIDFHAHAALY